LIAARIQQSSWNHVHICNIPQLKLITLTVELGLTVSIEQESGLKIITMQLTRQLSKSLLT
jgi:hypothetical protein